MSELRYEVEVKFHEDFVKAEGNKIIVGLTSKPEEGKANLELIKKLAKHFNVPSTHVKIVAGLKSRRKVVEILGISHSKCQ
ncbi:MAG: DUF167 domain-containing protein [Candidatus Bathyarchaeia archaeon]